jgi:hypothetical protein
MKTGKLIASLLLITTIFNPMKAQDIKATDTKSKLDYSSTIGITSGINHSINAFRDTPNSSGNNFYKGTDQFNFGINYSLVFSKKFRSRFELKYFEYTYNAGWENADLPVIKKSVVSLDNIDFNYFLDYKFLEINKFQMFVSPGIKWEINVNREEKNYRNDNTFNWANYNGIIGENSRFLMAGSVSVVAKYNITKNISLVIDPDYTIFFRKYVSTNSKNYQRMSLNFGLEFNLY